MKHLQWIVSINLLALAPASIGFKQPEQTAPPSTAQSHVEGILVEYRFRDVYEGSIFLHNLHANNDTEALQAIRDRYDSSDATGYLAARLDAPAAVALCRRLEPRRPHWRAAFETLGSHPRDQVIDYVLEIVQAGDLLQRAVCYEVSEYAGWTDLIEYAQRDIASMAPGNENQVNRPRDPELAPSSLGDFARRYLRSMRAEVR